MKDVTKKVKNDALALSGAGIVSDKTSGAQLAIAPLADVDLNAKIDQEIDRLFKSVTGGLRAFLKPAGIGIHNVHIDWGYPRSQAAEVYGHLRRMQISPEVRSARPGSKAD